jgi:uracil-DNA glycosylase
LLGRDPDLLTNQRLEWLLRETCRCGLEDIYATNAFPLVKNGGISAPISQRHIREMARQFLRKEVEIIRPRYIFALGLKAAFALQMAEVAELSGVEIIKLPHPAARWNNAAMLQRWRKVLAEVGFELPSW